MKEQHYHVEFVGGPLDGHRQAVTVPVSDLNPHATFPINRNLFRLLNRRPAGKHHPVTSVANYRLVTLAGRLRYEFAGTVSPLAAGFGKAS